MRNAAGPLSYIMAVECGGSHVRAVLHDLANAAPLLKITFSQSGNIHTCPESTLAGIKAAMQYFADQVGMNIGHLKDITQLSLFLPGLSNQANVKWLREQLSWHKFFHITSDAMAGFFGAYDELKYGQGVLILGTGTIGIGYIDEAFIRVAGTGHDRELCCGYAIGKGALDPERGLLDAPEFKPYCNQNFDVATPRNIISQLAPAVFHVMNNGHGEASKKAGALIQDAADCALEYIQQLHMAGVETMTLAGGLAPHLIEFICANMRRHELPVKLRLAVPDAGFDGALRAALMLHEHPQMLAVMNRLIPIENLPPVASAAFQPPQNLQLAYPMLG